MAPELNFLVTPGPMENHISLTKSAILHYANPTQTLLWNIKCVPLELIMKILGYTKYLFIMPKTIEQYLTNPSN